MVRRARRLNSCLMPAMSVTIIRENKRAAVDLSAVALSKLLLDSIA